MNDSDNVIALTDEAQAVRRTYGYDDWGTSGGTSGTLALPDADRARWKGALWMGSELDLYYMRNRWYEPATGRFLSEDPIGLHGGINPVVFAGGDPVSRRDPSGLCELWLVRVERIFVNGRLVSERELFRVCVKESGNNGGGSGARSSAQEESFQRCPAISEGPGEDVLKQNMRTAEVLGSLPGGHLFDSYDRFVGMVNDHMPWDYKDQNPNWERFGNQHFGAVGQRYGISLGTLMTGSIANALKKANKVKTLWGGAVKQLFMSPGDLPGNEREDLKAIREGYLYALRNCDKR